MIAFIILNFNTWEMTTRCVDSIYSTCKQGFKIYIVDNGSTNESYPILTEKYKDEKEVIVIQSENLGYARGNNIGIRQAIKDGYKTITIANNDVIFLENSIDTMYSFLLSNKDVGVASPYILSPEGHIQNLPFLKPITTKDYLLYNTKISKFSSSKKFNEYENKYYLNPDSIHDEPISIYKFSGCCFMAKAEMLEEVGLFDENTFLYYEEDILCQKINLAGYEAYFLPNSKIIHHHGLTTGKDNLFVDTEMFKSELYFLSRYHKMNFLGLLFIYLDRAVTPIMKKTKGKYNLTRKEYIRFLKITWKHLMKNAR
ncbi:glycosyltransferase family 2 protein [Bacillus sp. 1P02SD]|uniref:glycosyltransferase family 2 protein n=1 Tax=Bacillus sp. 1P02SD TaxID=3132264 RepID=UPI0039A1A4B7